MLRLPSPLSIFSLYTPANADTRVYRVASTTPINVMTVLAPVETFLFSPISAVMMSHFREAGACAEAPHSLRVKHRSSTNQKKTPEPSTRVWSIRLNAAGDTAVMACMYRLLLNAYNSAGSPNRSHCATLIALIAANPPSTWLSPRAESVVS